MCTVPGGGDSYEVMTPGTHVDQGQKVTYQCKEFYTIEDQSKLTRMCGEGGELKGEDPVCKGTLHRMIQRTDRLP